MRISVRSSRYGFTRFFLIPLALLALAISTGAGTALAGETAVNVFGFSHHFEDAIDGPLREFNPGAGLQWTFARARQGSLETNVGVYQDSYGHANWHWSLGARWRVAGPVELGLQAINTVSASFSGGYPAVVPYPFTAVRLRDVTVNLAYLPEIGTINGIPSLATYVTVRPWWRRARDSGNADATAAREEAVSALEFDVTGLPELDGFKDSGIMWQQRFDARHGLRLGLELGGIIESNDHPGGVSYGSYRAAVLMQYMRRLAPRGRVSPYWATGLEAEYVGGHQSDTVSETWRTDFGLAYRLDEAVSLAFEYGLRAGAERDAATYSGEPTRSRENWYLEAAPARLVLVIERGTAPRDAPSRLPAGGSSLAFALGEYADPLQSLRAMSIAWRTLDGPTRAWRFVITPQARSRSEDTYDASDSIHGLAARVERHFRHPATDRLVTYWGVGPLLQVGYQESERPSGTGGTRLGIRRNFGIGVTALVGAEYAFAADLYLLAEHSTDLRWDYLGYDPGSTYRSVRLGGDGARLGIGVQF